MAPEYLAFRQLTEKADVNSFGVMLLEIFTGRQSFEYTDNTDSVLESVSSRCDSNFNQYNSIISNALFQVSWN